MVRQSSQGSDVLVRETHRFRRCVPGQESSSAIWVKRSVLGDLGRFGLSLASASLPLSVALLCLPTALADGGHVDSVCGNRSSAFFACLRRFFGIEAMDFAVRMSGAPSLRARGPQQAADARLGGTGGGLAHIGVHIHVLIPDSILLYSQDGP